MVNVPRRESRPLGLLPGCMFRVACLNLPGSLEKFALAAACFVHVWSLLDSTLFSCKRNTPRASSISIEAVDLEVTRSLNRPNSDLQGVQNGIGATNTLSKISLDLFLALYLFFKAQFKFDPFPLASLPSNRINQ